VKWYSDEMGCGFIEQEGGKDLFVHYTAINMSDFKTIEEGDDVIFDIEESDRRLVAKNVTKLKAFVTIKRIEYV